MGNNIDRANIASTEDQVQFVKSIEAIDREIASLKGELGKKIADLNQDVKDILEMAKGKGVPKAVLKTIIANRRDYRRIAARNETLEDHEVQIIVPLGEAIGDMIDLPLGMAAKAREEGKPDATTAAIIAAVQADEAGSEAKPDFTADKERDAAAFDQADAGKPAGEVVQLDPGAARAARAKRAGGGKKAEEKAPERDTTKFPVTGDQPGEVRF